MSVCVGCLGSRRCWICLGTGILDNRPAEAVTCGRCYGSGICSYCHDVTVVDLTQPESERRSV